MNHFSQLSTETLSAKVHARIKAALINGEFAPGERLRINDLAEDLGTSITPVREAVFRLVSEGGLEFKAATAVHVPILRPDDLRQILLMRLALEGSAAARACELVTEDDVKRLEDLQEKFIKAAATDARLAARLNRKFHFALLTGSRMPLVTATVENLWVMMGPLLRTFHIEVPRTQIVGPTHKHYKVLKALRRRDPEAARAAIQDDIRWSNVLIAWLEEQHSASHKSGPMAAKKSADKRRGTRKAARRSVQLT